MRQSFMTIFMLCVFLAGTGMAADKSLMVDESGAVLVDGVDMYVPDMDRPSGSTPPIVPAGCSPVQIQTLATATSSGGGTTSYGPQWANDGLTGYPENPACYGPNCFCWLSTSSATSTGAWYQLTWTSTQTICGIFMDTKDAFSYEGGPRLSRHVGNCRIQWWNGTTWVTDGAIVNATNDWTYTFTSPVSTTRLRLMDVNCGTVTPCTLEYNYCRNPMLYEVCVFSGSLPATATPTPRPTSTPAGSPGPCASQASVDAIEAKLDALAPQVAAIEGKLDDETRFTDDGEFGVAVTAVNTNSAKLDAVEAKLDALGPFITDALLDATMRDIENNLAQKLCLSWMYTPNDLGGYLEDVFSVIQNTIDVNRALGCSKIKYLDEAQCILDKARDLAALAPPMDCEVICGTLIKAYQKASSKSGGALKCDPSDETP